MTNQRSQQKRDGSWVARWLVWSLWWELIVAVAAGMALVVYGLVLERQYASEGIIQGADSIYVAQEVVLPLWLLASAAAPFVVYSRACRNATSGQRDRQTSLGSRPPSA